MRTHADYLNSVARLMQRQAATAQSARGQAIRAARVGMPSRNAAIGDDPLSAIEGAAGGALGDALGGPAGGALGGALGSALGSALPSADPTAALSSAAVNAVTAAVSPSVNAGQPPSAGGVVPTTSVQQGINAAKGASSGQAIDAARTALPTQTTPGFDAGVALAAGAAKFGKWQPPGLSDAAKAGWLLAHGLNGAPPEIKTAVLSAISHAPEIKKGAAKAIGDIQKGVHPASGAAQSLTLWETIEGWWDSFTHWIGVT